MTVTENPISWETVATIGAFNALHKGHRLLIEYCREKAEKTGRKVCVYTFDGELERHKKGEEFMSREKKMRVLENLGVDIVFMQKFSREFKEKSPEEFVQDILVDTLNCKCIIVGENFQFGKNAAGNALVLENLCKEKGIECRVVPLVKTSDGGVISSSYIRSLAGLGNVEKIAEYCGRPLCISGKVIHGREEGRRLGFPTANLVPEGGVVPARGVYASYVMREEKIYPAITNIGSAPTYGVDRELAETHIIGLEADLYGTRIEVYLLEKMRDINKFENVDNLKKQLAEDREMSIKINEKYNINE